MEKVCSIDAYLQLRVIGHRLPEMTAWSKDGAATFDVGLCYVLMKTLRSTCSEHY